MPPIDDDAQGEQDQESAIEAVDAALQDQGFDTPEETEEPAEPGTAEAKPAEKAVEEDANKKKPDEPKGDEEKTASEIEAEEAAKKAEEAAGKELTPEEQAAKDDADVDALADMKGRTKERFEQKIEQLKEKDATIERLTTEHAQAVEHVQEVQQVFAETGASPEELAGLLEYPKLLRSGDPVDLRKARDILSSQLQSVSLALGEPVGAIDPLAEFPDLREGVEAMEITEEAAIELARGRKMQAAQQAHNQTVNQQAQQGVEYNASVGQSVTQIAALTDGWKNTDPDFALKNERLKGMVQQIIQANPNPQTWPAMVGMMYQNMSVAKPRTATPKVPLNETGAVASTEPPKTAIEAAEQALADL